MKSRLLLGAAAVSLLLASRGADWESGPGHRWAPLESPRGTQPGFAAVDFSISGILFTNALSDAAIAGNRVLANGSGAAVGDFNGDGLPDLYLCGLETPNVLYQNLGGWKFREIAREAGVACEDQHSRGAVFADVTGDGWLDLLVSTHKEGVRVFMNDRQGKFIEGTERAGTSSQYGSMTLALADVDGDGDLDLYVANNRPDDIRDRGRVTVQMAGGRPVLGTDTQRFVMNDGRLAENGQPDQLFLNDGTGRFTEVPWAGGTFLDEESNPLTEAPLDWGLTATFRDVNGDGAPDLYVCNDFWTPDRFWLNDGKGTFRAVSNVALRKTSASSMAVDFADLDRDGHLDFLALDMLSRDPAMRKRQNQAQLPMPGMPGMFNDRPQVMRNTLFRNRGDGTFAEIADYAGISASDWSWSILFLDADLDGFEDALISGGHFRDIQDMDAERQVEQRQQAWDQFQNEALRQRAFTAQLLENYKLYPPLDMPVAAFRNQGNLRFTETTSDWGLTVKGTFHAIAAADFDLDGDMDLIVSRLNGPALLLENTAAAPRVQVRLKGELPNRDGTGALVKLIAPGLPSQSFEITTGGRYLSGSEPAVAFAAVEGADMRIEVAWRSGKRSIIERVRAGRVYEVYEPREPTPLPSPILGPAIPQFADASDALAHRHHELSSDDFARQPLLPFKLSQAGPGAAWFDIDGDGSDDLFIGAGRGGAPVLFLNRSGGQFQRIELPPVPDDLAAVSGAVVDGQPVLWAALAGYETEAAFGALQVTVRNGKVDVEPVLPELKGATVLATGDMGGDGTLDLFAGGGAVPGRYPEGRRGLIFNWRNGAWREDTQNSVLLHGIGIVNSALWSDLTGDGKSELVLACEWGPVRVFESRSGGLFEITAELGLDAWTGWWRGIATGDFNGDGLLDIAASNWGENSPFKASRERPLVWVHGQFARPGVFDLIETEYDSTARLTPVRMLPVLARSLPFLRSRFASDRAFSEATLDQVMGNRLALGSRVEAVTLQSMVFLNTGQGFKPVPLPLEAQLAPVFGIQCADFDSDGHEDLVLAQNFFATRPDLPRIDAGRGLYLRGDGTGRFHPAAAGSSGIAVYGEQRALSLGDFDNDGRTDIVLTQNGAETKLYRNIGSRSGLRVHLKGPPGNVAAIGAAVRLDYENGHGPVREVQAGSGYFGQNSFRLLLGRRQEEPVALWIRWPGGRETRIRVPPDAQEISAAF